MAKCTTCGTELPPDKKFCTECGAPSPEAMSEPKLVSSPPIEPAPFPPPAAPNPAAEPTPATTSAPASVAVAAPPVPPPAEPSKPAKPTKPEKPPRAAATVTPDVMSTLSYIGHSILFSIPILGYIICLITAFASKKPNKRNFARAMLIFIIIGIVLASIAYFVTNWAVGVAREYITEVTGQLIGDGESFNNLGDLSEIMKAFKDVDLSALQDVDLSALGQ